MTTTYVIGKRSKAYFTKRVLRKRAAEDEGNFEDFDDENLESWEDSVKLLTGADERALSTYMKEAIKDSALNMKNTVKGAKNYTTKKGKSSFKKIVGIFHRPKPVEEEITDDNKVDAEPEAKEEKEILLID